MRFNKHLLVTAVTGVIFSVAPTHAQVAENPDYWLIKISENHTHFSFIDASTVTRDGPYRSVWLTEIFAGKDVAKHDVRRKMIFTMFDCRRNSSRENRIVTYDRRGDVLTDRSRDTGNYNQIVPGSTEAIEIEFVCGNSNSWPLRKGWTEIDVSPEKMADNDNRAFQTH